MSLKVKFLKSRLPGDASSQIHVRKVSWIEILRRLRETLEQVFRFLSSCIDKEVEQILASQFNAIENIEVEWSKIQNKFVHLALSCAELVSAMNLESSSSQNVVISSLEDVINLFGGREEGVPPMRDSCSIPSDSTEQRNEPSETTEKRQDSDNEISVVIYSPDQKSQTSPSSRSSVERSGSSVLRETKTEDESLSTIEERYSPIDDSASTMSDTHGRRSSRGGTTSQENRSLLQSNSYNSNSNFENSRLQSEFSAEKRIKKRQQQLGYTSTERSGKSSSTNRRCTTTFPTDSSSTIVQNAGPKSSEPLLIFDRRGNPLTDHNGVPLINMNRKLVIKYKDNKPMSHSNGDPIFDHCGLPFVASFDEPLMDVDGKPLQLFNQENIPLTDANGYVLKLSNGSYTISLDEYNRIMGDTFGSPIYDEKGKMLTASLSNRKQGAPMFGTQEDGSCIMLYNEKGFLLTDKWGKPLRSANGQPLIKIGPSGEIMDITGGPVYDENGKLYGSKARVPYLCLYDCNKYPLTNSKGDVLHDASGRPLVIFDPNGKPISDMDNRVVYDAFGVPCNDPAFQACADKAKKPRPAIFDVDVKIFNSKGRPVVDYDGTSLLNSDGHPLVVMRGNKPSSDIEGNALYDQMGIPVSQVNSRWICPQGEPFRVFDNQGRPLTDKRGRDLYTINGQCLLKCDKLGRPVLTYTKGHVCDCSGTPVTDEAFDPIQTPPNDELRMQVFVLDTPLKVFDRFGKPLSDSDGMALVDARGRCMIQFNEAGIPNGDIHGGTIFDENRLPLGCSQNASILSMNGLPFRVFDVHKRPLTNRKGFPMSLANEKPLIKFDSVGRPVSDLVGGPVLDFRGRNVAGDPEARGDSVLPEVDHVVKDPQGQPLQLFDASGWPLTDAAGLVLVNADGTHLRLNHHGTPVADPNGGPLFDQYGTPLEQVFLNSSRPQDEQPAPTPSEEITTPKLDIERDAFGRPLKDSLGTPQFDTYGRPLYDLYRRHMFDHLGRPIADSTGRRIMDGRREPTFKLSFDVRILQSAIKWSCLKKYNTGPHKDLLGGPLFDSEGAPLYNEYGKPVVDMYGRDLYDSQGHMLCDSRGKPCSKQLKTILNDRHIVDVRDVVKMIRVPKEVIPMMSSSLVAGKRVADSVILPGSCVAETSQKMSSRPWTAYWALLRISELSDGTLVHELLKAMPLEDDSSASKSETNSMGAGDHLKERKTSAQPHSLFTTSAKE